MRSLQMLFFLSFAVRAFAQAPTTPLETAAQQHYQAREWQAAVDTYRQVAVQKPQDPWPHYFLGVALQELGRHPDAMAELESADRLGLPQVQSAFRFARSFAQQGALDRSFEAMGRAVDLGFRQKPLMETDAMLAPLRTDPRFPALLERIDRAIYPCRYQEESRQFDFWIGDWDVFTALAPTAAPIARSRIESAEASCAVLEFYTQNAGYTGRSINIYDTNLKKWRQFYVDNTGRVTRYIGESRDGNMYFTAEPSPGTPSGTQNRMTFFAEGRDQVRQVLERSTDGVTWTKTFDGIYKRRKN